MSTPLQNLAWGSIISGPSQVHRNQRILPPSSSVSSVAYAAPTNKVKQRSLTTTSYDVSGWRDPQPYGAYLALVEPKAYNYIAYHGSEEWRYWGDKTPVNNTLGPGTHLRYHGTVPGSLTTREPDISSAYVERCKTEAMAKFGTPDINLSVSMIEYKKLGSLLGEKVVQFASLYRWFVVSRGVNRTGWTPQLWSEWLQYRYAWLPLMYDAYGLVNALQDITDQEPKIISVSRELGWSGGDPAPIGSSLRDWKWEGSTLFGVRTKLYAKPYSWVTSLIKSLGLTNPSLIAWELVPFSFVVDWWFPIGTWLSALYGWIGLDFLGGTTVTFTQTKGRATFYLYTTTYKPSFKSGDKPSIELDITCMKRIAHYSWPFPLPYFKMPFTNSTRVLDALALLKFSKY